MNKLLSKTPKPKNAISKYKKNNICAVLLPHKPLANAVGGGINVSNKF